MICGICNSEFEKTNKRRKFCSDECRLKNDKQKEKEYNRKRIESGKTKEYYQNNRDRMIGHVRGYQIKTDYARLYKKRNKIKFAGYEAKRRAQKKSVYCEDVNFDAITLRDNLICWLCSNKIDIQDLEFDHAIPLSKGGLHVEQNIYCTHAECNRRKHIRLPHELETIFPNINKQTLQKLTESK